MTKRIIGLLLALLLLACMPALAEEPKWSYDNDNMYLKLDGDLSGDVTIPSEVDGYLVNAIEDNAFYEQHEITSLTMPDSLRSLKGGVISSMDSLTQVTLKLLPAPKCSCTLVLPFPTLEDCADMVPKVL